MRERVALAGELVVGAPQHRAPELGEAVAAREQKARRAELEARLRAGQGGALRCEARARIERSEAAFQRGELVALMSHASLEQSFEVVAPRAEQALAAAE